MASIRNSQIKQSEDVLRANFDASVAETFRDVWPDRVQELTEAYPKFIHDAIDRSYAQEIDDDDDVDVARFVNLTLLWGLGFDESPAHPWASRILADRTASAGIRVELLYERSEAELNAISPVAALVGVFE